MKRRVIISGIITLVFLIVFVFTGPVYSAAGDGSIAKYLASNAEPGFNSVSWGLGAFLKIFVGIFPSVNWWTMFSIFMMFSVLFFMTLFIQELFDGIKGIIIAVVFAIFLWEAAYSIDINFTQTAILSGITGTSASLLISYRKSFKGKVFYGIIGALYILIAGSLRFDAMIMCIPFAGVVIALRYLLVFMHKGNASKVVDNKRLFIPDIFVPLFVIICSVVLSYGSHLVYRHMNPNIAFFEDTFDLTREVYDYLDMYPEYNEVSDVYESAGLKASWYAMLTNYYIADTNYFNIETMSVPIQFKGASVKTFRGYMAEMLKYKYALILGLTVMIIAGIFTSIKKNIISVSSAIAVFIASGMYFVHVGRYAWRVSGGVTVACVVMGLMMLEVLVGKHFFADNKELKDADITKNEAIDSSAPSYNKKGRYIAGYLIAAICMVWVGVHIIATKSLTFPRSEVTDEALAGLLDYMDSNEDIIYFTEDYDYASHNVWYVGDPGYLDNKFTIFAGYNEGRNTDLQAVGISDMSQFVINMLTRDDIYTEYTDVWSSYLCDYYNPYVSAGIVDIYEPTGTQFIRYVAPIEASEDRFDDTVSDVSLYVDSSKQTDSYQVVHVDAKVLLDNDDVEYYMNIENSSTGAIYSYPLVRDGDTLTGDAIWKNDTWSFMDTNQYIVGKYSDGTIVRVLNITGTPVPFV
ncbi:MAG: hypothetical protein K6G87_17515 [Butyrivibrio sp.]|uniref:hypothetical protein n=1 Tax=Butyrivibrio sp. TaxID=28121 RepID=UPI0025F010CE|nr:hypothetical protein [Butyrivibrio sp.]MCR5773026.1 hypothetical protein [Butyrivibrio sp.]